MRKKLTEKTSWYKERRRNDEGDEQIEKENWRGVRRGENQQKEKDGKKNKKIMGGEEKKRSQVKAVMFVPYTKGSKLAKKLRENEEAMEKVTGYRLKIVERSGIKIENLLTKSNPCSGEECSRVGCLLCKTKADTRREDGPKLCDAECDISNLVRKLQEDGGAEVGGWREWERSSPLHIYRRDVEKLL